MEDSLIKVLAQSGASFVLLGYVIYQLMMMQRLLVERNADMASRLIESNLSISQSMTQALRDLEQSRAEQRQAHAEQILLTKMTLDKVAEALHG